MKTEHSLTVSRINGANVIALDLELHHVLDKLSFLFSIFLFTFGFLPSSPRGENFTFAFAHDLIACPRITIPPSFISQYVESSHDPLLLKSEPVFP